MDSSNSDSGFRYRVFCTSRQAARVTHPRKPEPGNGNLTSRRRIARTGCPDSFGVWTSFRLPDRGPRLLQRSNPTSRRRRPRPHPRAFVVKAGVPAAASPSPRPYPHLINASARYRRPSPTRLVLPFPAAIRPAPEP